MVYRALAATIVSTDSIVVNGEYLATDNFYGSCIRLGYCMFVFFGVAALPKLGRPMICGNSKLLFGHARTKKLQDQVSCDTPLRSDAVKKNSRFVTLVASGVFVVGVIINILRMLLYSAGLTNIANDIMLGFNVCGFCSVAITLVACLTLKLYLVHCRNWLNDNIYWRCGLLYRS